jgi:ribonuclease HI
VLHGGDLIHPNLLIQEGEALLLQLKDLEGQNGSAPTEARVGKAKWSPPQVGKRKVNWDVSFDNKNQRMGVGIIVRDHCGMVCAAKSEVIQMLHEPGAGEAWGALRATEFCVEMGFFDIILEGDSLTVVKAIGDAEASMRPFGQIVEDIKEVLGSLRSWLICHVKRDANQAAHGLAKNATVTSMEQNWIEETPNCISDIVKLELLALST